MKLTPTTAQTLTESFQPPSITLNLALKEPQSQMCKPEGNSGLSANKSRKEGEKQDDHDRDRNKKRAVDVAQGLHVCVETQQQQRATVQQHVVCECEAP